MVLGKIQQDRHGGMLPIFKSSVKSSFQDCLSRQVAEGVQIRRFDNEVLNENQNGTNQPYGRTSVS